MLYHGLDSDGSEKLEQRELCVAAKKIVTSIGTEEMRLIYMFIYSFIYVEREKEIIRERNERLDGQWLEKELGKDDAAIIDR